jgi:hypothetical protein
MKYNKMQTALAALIKANVPTLIVGQAGHGKSDMVDNVAKQIGYDLIISHPAISDPTDYKGLYYVGDGKTAQLLPASDLQALISAKKPTVCFLDDAGQAPPSVQAALMQLVQARRVGEHVISKHVSFVLASNRKGDKSGVYNMFEALKSRMVILNLEYDTNDHVNWLLENEHPIPVIGFVRFRPELISNPAQDNTTFSNFACPRSIAKIKQIEAMSLDSETEFEIITGAVGQSYATEYAAFKQVFGKIPTIKEIVGNPETCAIPTDLSSKFATATSIPFKIKDAQTLDAVCKYILRWDSEYVTMFMGDIIKNPTTTSLCGKSELFKEICVKAANSLY